MTPKIKAFITRFLKTFASAFLGQYVILATPIVVGVLRGTVVQVDVNIALVRLGVFAEAAAAAGLIFAIEKMLTWTDFTTQPVQQQ